MPSKFRLDRVLDHKRQLEQERQRDLQTVTAEERRLLEELRELQQREREHIEALSARTRQGGVDSEQLQAALAYIDTITKAIARQERLLAECGERVRTQREALVAALQEKQSLETLKRKQQEAERLEANREEAKRIDDLSTNRYARRRREV
ncbi:MAG: flagellar export protein FliJ [Dehalococcoidia bacterium]